MSADAERTRDTGPASRVVWPLAVVLAAGVLAYVPGLSAPFIFDDLTSIPQNPHIRQLWPIHDAMSAPPGTTVAGRPIVSLSLAVNYAVVGLDVRGYRVFNLVVHLMSTLLLFGIVRRTLRSCVFGQGQCARADRLALAAAALWMIHPLHTECVTYVVQRTELLVGLFYLLTLHCCVRGCASPRRAWWSTAAVVSCALGMASKEVMVTAPLVVLLYDRTFVSGTLRDALSHHKGLYAGLAATWLILAALVWSGQRAETVGSHHGLSALDYLRTQSNVVLWYLRLSFRPGPLSIAYDDWPVARQWGDCIGAGLVVVALLIATVWVSRRRPAAGFLGAWFFLILAPSSSFVPIATEIAAERRMYLPLAAVAVLVVVGGWQVLERVCKRVLHGRVPAGWIGVGMTLALAAALGHWTAQRNGDYRTARSIWEDTVVKRPRSATAHMNLGNVQFEEGDSDEAVRHYAKALQVKPGFAEAHYNLANALVERDRIDDALRHYAEAIRINPRHADAYNNRGIVLCNLGRIDEGIEQYLEALRIKPDHVGAGTNLFLANVKKGDVLLDASRFDEAAAEYRKVLALDPTHVGAHFSLGIALAMQNKRAEAIGELREALRLDPHHAGARRVLEDLLADRP